jgi:hypothetical protein
MVRHAAMRLPRFTRLVVSTAAILFPSALFSQAFTPPEGVGSVTIAGQYIDNTGHRLTDGFLRSAGQSVTASILLEAEYGVTDRFAATAGIPYVFAKYTGGLPPRSGLPVDACRCWHSGTADVSLSARYRFGDHARALTPVVRYVLPSSDYQYRGEAVVGRRLQELQFGLNAGARLRERISVGGGYSYSFVERPLPDISIDRSDVSVNAGYAITDRLYVHGLATGVYTHGGLRVGSLTGRPFFLPGEFNTPERIAQGDRLVSTQYVQGGAGASYAFSSMDVFVSYTKYVWGRNAHSGHSYTIGTTWYFDRSKL